MDKPEFTAREVRTLVERVESKIDLLAEAFMPIPKRLDRIEERLSVVEVRLTEVGDAIRVAIPDLYKRVGRLEAKAGF